MQFQRILNEVRAISEGADLRALFDQWDASPHAKAKIRKAYKAFVKAGHAPALPALAQIKNGKAWEKVGGSYVLKLQGEVYKIDAKRHKASGVITMSVSVKWTSGQSKVLAHETTSDPSELAAMKARMHEAVVDHLKYNRYEGGLEMMSDWLRHKGHEYI